MSNRKTSPIQLAGISLVEYIRARPVIIDLSGLFMAALVLRMAYLYLAIEAWGVQYLWSMYPDTVGYLSVADNFLNGNPSGEYYLFQVGPGYGLLLAGIRLISGPSPFAEVGLSLVLGCLAPMMIYLIAGQLTGSRWVSILAGGISTISTTSIAMSCNILSDQPYFTFQAATIFFFIAGFKSGRMKWFVVAGLFGGVSACVRGIGQALPFLFLGTGLIVPLPGTVTSRLKMLRKVGTAAGIAALIIVSWSLRNYVVHDVFTFGGNGVRTARLYLAASADATHSESSWREVYKRWMAEDSSFFREHDWSIAKDYRRSADQLSAFARDHPKWMAEEFCSHIKYNVFTGNHTALRQTPQLQRFWHRLILLKGKWIGHSIVLATCLGIILLILRRRYLAGVLLGQAYVFFTVATGLSFSQGTRLHYPAELASAISIAYLLQWTGGTLVSLYRKLTG